MSSRCLSRHRVIVGAVLIENKHRHHCHLHRIVPNHHHTTSATARPSHPHHDGFALKCRENRARLRAQDKVGRLMEQERQRRLINDTEGDGAQKRWRVSNIHRVFVTEIAYDHRRRLRAQNRAMRGMDTEKQRRSHLLARFPSKKPPKLSIIRRVFVMLGGVDGEDQGQRVRARDKAIQRMEMERQHRVKAAAAKGFDERPYHHSVVSNVQRVWITEAARENRERLRAQHFALVAMERERQSRTVAAQSEMSAVGGIMTNVQRVFITEIARENRQRIRAQDEALQGIEEERISRIDRMMARRRHIPRSFVCRIFPER